MIKRRKKKQTKKERAIDIIKETLAWIIITVLAFLYWMAVLLILSLVLLNVWHTSIEAIITYATVLTVITSLAYLGRKIYKGIHS